MKYLLVIDNRIWEELIIPKELKAATIEQKKIQKILRPTDQ